MLEVMPDYDCYLNNPHTASTSLRGVCEYQLLEGGFANWYIIQWQPQTLLAQFALFPGSFPHTARVRPGALLTALLWLPWLPQPWGLRNKNSALLIIQESIWWIISMATTIKIYSWFELWNRNTKVCVCAPKSHNLKSVFSDNVIKLWWTEQEPACLSSAAKRRPKPTAAGETWQSCRLRKGRVLSRLLMILVVAGVQTDTAELVCTVRGRRFIHASREKRDQGGRKPLLLTKTERTSLDDVAP